ncbi:MULTISPECIES: hypothetical protein [unclassified Streptomyces]|uniref:hypothetical protein n=1 Tax=unclassified Streptomyces TaxID=2593676 RepID=UPI002E2FCE55|nr:hypothetical protein [Streptomyces sp. NBC_01261]WSX55586.1 hypothetical protein OG504_03750 [Streptomyces sp. NBC_00986]
MTTTVCVVVRHPQLTRVEQSTLRQLERDTLAGSLAVRKTMVGDRREMAAHSDGDLRQLKLPYHRGREAAVRIVARDHA